MCPSHCFIAGRATFSSRCCKDQSLWQLSTLSTAGRLAFAALIGEGRGAALAGCRLALEEVRSPVVPPPCRTTARPPTTARATITPRAVMIHGLRSGDGGRETCAPCWSGAPCNGGTSRACPTRCFGTGERVRVATAEVKRRSDEVQVPERAPQPASDGRAQSS